MNISSKLKENAFLWGFGLTQVPMILWTGPSILHLSEDRVVIKIPLSRRTKNHLGAMYFGALAVGADCAGGILAMRRIRKEKHNVSLVFKDFKAEFLKRAEGDVLFTCEDGLKISRLLDETLQSKERVHATVHILATVPSQSGTEPVARFELTLSLKAKK